MIVRLVAEEEKMRELSLREIQLGELQILKRLDEICKENGFKYFLAYGTLIGAVRHKGFIPWDDDVDVAMPREDYNRLIQYCIAHAEEMKPIVLKHWSVDKNYIYPIARLCDTRYKIEYKDAVDYELGLFVDIYPYDGCGNSMQDARKIFKELGKARACAVVAGNNHFIFSKTSFWRNLIKYPMYLYAKMRGAGYFVKKVDLMAQERADDTDRLIYCTIWGFDINWAIPREVFDEALFVEFEGCRFPAPVRYDEWLRVTYNDYMQLPPESDRIAHHYYKAYKKDE